MAKTNENLMEISAIAPYTIGGVTFDPTESPFPPDMNAGLFRQGLVRIVGVYVGAAGREDPPVDEQTAALAVYAALESGTYKFGQGGARRDPLTVHLHDYIAALILKIAKGSKAVDVSKAVKADAESALRVQCGENGKDFAKAWAKANKVAARRVEEDNDLDDVDVSDVAVAA